MKATIKGLFIFYLLVFQSSLIAQVYGTVADEEGRPLPYATVYISNSTIGTTTNAEGYYELKLVRGDYDIVYQFLGYEQKTIAVSYEGSAIEINCSLEPHSFSLELLDVFASAEDPAYPIMRKVIEKRSFYRDYLNSYQCDVYVKGLFEIEKIPEMFRKAVEESLTEGVLDSSGRGIIYLSESESQFYYQKPDLSKEVLISSKVSGDPQGFSFNRFGVLNFYGDQITIGRPLVNPIGPNAFSHYKYSLEKTFYDEKRRMVHHILVEPKNQNGPTFSGEIYILDGMWLLHSLDLTLTGEAIKIDALKSVNFKQQFIPADPNYWSLFSQIIEFEAGLMGFEISGNFTAITSNYVLNPTFEKDFFGREVVKITEESNQKDDAYWNKSRPVPLSQKEESDYIFKDSLAELTSSKPYMDSVDRAMNKYTWTNILGYTFRRSYEGQTYRYRLATDIYDPIRGWSGGVDLEYSKNWKDITGKSFRISGKYLYGISDGEHRGSISIFKRFNAKSQFYIDAYVGYDLLDINPLNTVNNLYNASIALFDGNSVNRYYNARRLKLELGREIGFGHFLKGFIELSDRREAFNTTSWSFKGRNTEFPPNNDFGLIDRVVNVSDNLMLLAQFNFTWRPGQKFTTYPDRRVYRGSKWPVFNLRMKAGWLDFNSPDFSLVNLAIYKNYIINTLAGSLSFHLSGGKFFNRPTYFHDFNHFIGSPLIFMDSDNYLRGFKMLPIYAFSGSDEFAQGQVEWNDNSWLFDRIPYVKKLGFSLVYGVSHLHQNETGHWTELSIGIDNLGFNSYRLFRFDFIWVYQNGNYSHFGVRLGSKVI